MNRRLPLSLALTFFWILSPWLVAQAQDSDDEPEATVLLRKAEAYESLARTNLSVLRNLYQRYLAGADRFGDKAGHARAFSQFFLGRCYLADSSGDRAKKAFEASRKAFQALDQKDWVSAIDKTLEGLNQKRYLRAIYSSTNGLKSDSRAEALRARDELVVKIFEGKDIPEANSGDGKPDYELVVGETDFGDRKTEETLVFWDPIRARVRVWAFAARALKKEDLETLAKVEALWLSGQNKAAWTLIEKEKSPRAKLLIGALQWRQGKRKEGLASWDEALKEEKSLLPELLRRRALLGAVDETLVSEIEEMLKELKKKAGKGTVGLRRHLAENGDLLWSLALMRRALSRGTKRAGRDALAALSIAERQFPAGARGEIYKHKDPRFPFVLGDLYITAHRFGDALSYIYDPQAVIADFPEAAATRKAIQELQLMEALTTNDAELELDSEKEAGQSDVLFEDYGALLEDEDAGKAPEQKEARVAPNSSLAAYFVLAAGLVLVAFAGLKLRRP